MRGLIVGLVGVVLAVTACSTASTKGATTPRQMCENALAVRVVSSGPLRTVGVLRGFTWGPFGYKPAKHAFPELPASTVATYCWTAQNGDYVSFGVTADRQKVSLGAIGGSTHIPSGPPQIP